MWTACLLTQLPDRSPTDSFPSFLEFAFFSSNVVFSLLMTSCRCLFIQAVEEFLGNVRSREQPHSAGLVSQPTAVKFLRARKFDVTRAIELFQAYKVRRSLKLRTFRFGGIAWKLLFLKNISLNGILGFVCFYLTFLQPSPKCLIMPRLCNACVNLRALCEVRSIYRWMNPKLHFSSNIWTALLCFVKLWI